MVEKMKFGICAINIDAYTYPETIIYTAEGAEKAGFESLWVVEHLVLSDPRIPQSPMEPTDRILDPLITLAFIAAHTKTIRLGTGVIVLPLRNPLILAKQLASIDVLSSGRLIFGFGIGYVEAEFNALGVPFDHRGSRADEYLLAMRSIWDENKPEYHGKFISFEHIQSNPRPTQRPYPEIIVGGKTPAAYRRAIMYANGYYGYGLSVEETAERVKGLRQAAEHYPRPESLGNLEVTITPDCAINLETAEKYSKLGVNRLNLIPPQNPTPIELDTFYNKVNKKLIALV
jgi:probable F420-dependent oxidoreductase